MCNSEISSKRILEGVSQFNTREFWQCHETLEYEWFRHRGSERELIQGIIQIAVGYHHYSKKNIVGALKLLKRGLERLTKFEPICLGIDVSKLVQAVKTNIKQLTELDDDKCDMFEFPTIILISH